MIICRKCLLTASPGLIFADVSQKSIAKIATVSPFTVAYDGSCLAELWPGLSEARLTRLNNETSRKTILVEGGRGRGEEGTDGFLRAALNDDFDRLRL